MTASLLAPVLIVPLQFWLLGVFFTPSRVAVRYLRTLLVIAWLGCVWLLVSR
jgi:hypothetical protein